MRPKKDYSIVQGILFILTGITLLMFVYRLFVPAPSIINVDGMAVSTNTLDYGWTIVLGMFSIFFGIAYLVVLYLGGSRILRSSKSKRRKTKHKKSIIESGNKDNEVDIAAS